MASIVNRTDYQFAKSTGVVNQTVTIPATTAGNTLILHSWGGANVTAKITNTSGAAFTSRGQASNAMSVSHHDFTAVGGETAVYLTLNGAENISGAIYEVSGLGAFVAATTATQVALAQVSDYQAKPATSVNLASGSGVLFGAWAAQTPTAMSASLRWRQMGPSGVLQVVDHFQPGSNNQCIYASGVADVTSSQRYPESLASAGDFRATSQIHGTTANSFVVQALYANSGAAINPAVNATVAENRKPGTYNANWWLGTAASTNSTIAGYTDKVSYAPGDTVNFKVDSTGNPFRVELVRLGFYGREGYAARNPLGQGGTITGTIQTQSAASVDGTLGSSSCAWTTNATWAIPSDAAPGLYLITYRRTDVTTNTAIGHFVVRDSSVTGKAAVLIPDSTYQAYNMWGATTDNGTLAAGTWTGRNLYQAGADGATSNFAHRSYAVCFDRPYSTTATLPQTSVLDSEISTIAFLESQGYPLAYLSDWDLDTSSTQLNAAALVAVIGHSEYWTTGIYDCIKNAVDNGVNLFCNSSNVALWRTRYAAADTNRRTLICYKDSGTRDVSAGFTGTGYDPVTPTGTWRDPLATNGIANPDRRVENALTGQMFSANAAITDNFQVAFADKNRPIWRNSATVKALASGASFTTTQTTAGYELDTPDGSGSQPPGLVQLNATTKSFSGHGVNTAGTTYSGAASGLSMTFTLYRRTSGALVFDTGSWRGMWGVTRWHGSNTPSGSVDLDWQNAFLAILYDLGLTSPSLTVLEPGDTALTDPAIGAPGPSRDKVAIAYGVLSDVAAPSIAYHPGAGTGQARFYQSPRARTPVANTTGTAAAPLGALTGTATGAVKVLGTATAALGALSGAATGTPKVFGTATANLGGLTAAATGTPKVLGVATAPLGALTASATGTPKVLGVAVANLGALTASATGAGPATVHGTATAALGGLTASATGTRKVLGVAAAPLGALSGAGVSVPRKLGTATTNLGALTAMATGLVKVLGAAAGGLGVLTGTALGRRTTRGTATATLGALSGVATDSARTIHYPLHAGAVVDQAVRYHAGTPT